MTTLSRWEAAAAVMVGMFLCGPLMWLVMVAVLCLGEGHP